MKKDRASWDEFLATNQDVSCFFCWDFPASCRDLKPSFERRVAAALERVVHVLEKIDEGAK